MSHVYYNPCIRILCYISRINTSNTNTSIWIHIVKLNIVHCTWHLAHIIRHDHLSLHLDLKVMAPYIRSCILVIFIDMKEERKRSTQRQDFNGNVILILVLCNQLRTVSLLFVLNHRLLSSFLASHIHNSSSNIPISLSSAFDPESPLIVFVGERERDLIEPFRVARSCAVEEQNKLEPSLCIASSRSVWGLGGVGSHLSPMNQSSSAWRLLLSSEVLTSSNLVCMILFSDVRVFGW